MQQGDEMIVLERRIFLPDVTIGVVWDTESDLKLWSVENPWKDNKLWVSCIPEGFYHIEYVSGLRKRGAEWVIKDVESRSNIEFHVANTSDDVQGCIGLGLGLGLFRGNTLGIAHSRDGTSRFNKVLESKRIEGEELFITKGKMS